MLPGRSAPDPLDVCGAPIMLHCALRPTRSSRGVCAAQISRCEPMQSGSRILQLRVHSMTRTTPCEDVWLKVRRRSECGAPLGTRHRCGVNVGHLPSRSGTSTPFDARGATGRASLTCRERLELGCRRVTLVVIQQGNVLPPRQDRGGRPTRARSCRDRTHTFYAHPLLEY